MDLMQIIRLAVMAAEVWGKYNGKHGEEKLQYALEYVRDVQPKLVDTNERLTAVVENIELVKDEFDARGWDVLSALAGGVQRIANRVQMRIAWLAKRVSWVADQIGDAQAQDVLDVLDGTD